MAYEYYGIPVCKEVVDAAVYKTALDLQTKFPDYRKSLFKRLVVPTTEEIAFCEDNRGAVVEGYKELLHQFYVRRETFEKGHLYLQSSMVLTLLAANIEFLELSNLTVSSSMSVEEQYDVVYRKVFNLLCAEYGFKEVLQEGPAIYVVQKFLHGIDATALSTKETLIEGIPMPYTEGDYPFIIDSMKESVVEIFKNHTPHD